MAFGNQNSVIQATPAGRIDSEFPTGADGSDLKPVWTNVLPDLSSLQVGTAFSVDLAASGAVLDPGSPASQLGFHFVGGDAAAAAGFSFSGSVLSNPCVLVTDGTFQFVAVRNGVSALSAQVSFSISAIAGTDNVAPSIPMNAVAVQGSAVNTITLTFDPPSDIAPGSTPASGVAHVDVLVNGTVSSPSPIVTPSNALAPPTGANIGTITSPDLPAFSQNAKVWTLSAAGTGISATTSEQCLLEDFGTLSGARKISARLNPFTSSSATAFMGLMVHETAAAGGRFLAIGLRPSNGTVGLYVISRATPSAASTQVTSLLKDANGQSIVGPVYVAITRAADGKTFTVSYALDQSGLLPITTVTITMGTTAHFGLFATSQSAGTDVTGTIDEVSITSGTPITATVNATATVNLQLRATDANNNVSGLSSVIQGVPKPPAVIVSGTVKAIINANGFWPNNQFWGTVASPGPAQNAYRNGLLPIIKSNKLINVFLMSMSWADMEGATRGDYTPAFNSIQAVLNDFAAINANDPTRKVMLMVKGWLTYFGSAIPPTATQPTGLPTITSTGSWPAYVIANGWPRHFYQAENGRSQLNWDVDDVWTAVTNMFTAIMAHFDGNKYFLSLGFQDETEAINVIDQLPNSTFPNLTQPPPWTSGESVMDPTHYNTKFEACMNAISDAGPHTLTHVPWNFLPPGGAQEATSMTAIIQRMLATRPGKWLFGGPDPWTHNTTYHNLMSGVTAGLGDLRRSFMQVAEVQQGKETGSGNPTVATIYARNIGTGAAVSGNTPGACQIQLWPYITTAQTDQVENINSFLAAISANNGASAPLPTVGSYQL